MGFVLPQHQASPLQALAFVPCLMTIHNYIGSLTRMSNEPKSDELKVFDRILAMNKEGHDLTLACQWKVFVSKVWQQTELN